MSGSTMVGQEQKAEAAVGTGLPKACEILDSKSFQTINITSKDADARRFDEKCVLWPIRGVLAVLSDSVKVCEMKQTIKIESAIGGSKIFWSDKTLINPLYSDLVERVFVSRLLKHFQANLCDMQGLAGHNDGLIIFNRQWRVFKQSL